MNEIKILLRPEFEHYHSLLTTYGEDLVEKFKQTLFAARYDDNLRILEFGSKSYFDNVVVTFADDGLGNVILTLPSSMSLSVDNDGNAIITGATFTSDGKCNVYIS